ncbi:hypothetical protein ACH4FX_04900 [Streptomyces sp. NPDC018019]|uniref:hypothetical protein n=1 Tax=Streptomyces sp. NPDC018019 TaxID=3365030 RepID=UPI003790395D
MQVFHVRFERGDNEPVSEEEAALVHDLLWAHAVPSDGLEHIRARSVEGGLDLFLFVRADGAPYGLRHMHVLLARAEEPLAAYGFAVPAA